MIKNFAFGDLLFEKVSQTMMPYQLVLKMENDFFQSNFMDCFQDKNKGNLDFSGSLKPIFWQQMVGHFDYLAYFFKK